MFVHTSCCECAVVRAAEPPGVMPVEQAAGRGPLWLGGLRPWLTPVFSPRCLSSFHFTLFLNPHQFWGEKGLVFVGVTLRSTVSKRKSVRYQSYGSSTLCLAR